MTFVKIDVMVELLYWIALDSTDVPNKMPPECISGFQVLVRK